MTWIIAILALAVPTAAILMVRSDAAEAQRVLAAVPVLAGIRLALLATHTAALGTLRLPVAIVAGVLLAELSFALMKGRLSPLLFLGAIASCGAALLLALVGPQALAGESLAWTGICVLTFVAVVATAGARTVRARR